MCAAASRQLKKSGETSRRIVVWPARSLNQEMSTVFVVGGGGGGRPTSPRNNRRTQQQPIHPPTHTSRSHPATIQGLCADAHRLTVNFKAI